MSAIRCKEVICTAALIKEIVEDEAVQETLDDNEDATTEILKNVWAAADVLRKLARDEPAG